MKKFIRTVGVCLVALLVYQVSTAQPSVTNKKAMTPEVLLSLQRLSSPTLSPDGDAYFYSRSIPNIQENKITSELVLGRLSNGSQDIILDATDKASQASFLSKDKIVYIGKAKKYRQIFLYDIKSGSKLCISNFDFDVQGYKFSPDLKHVVVIRDIQLPNITQERNPDLDKATGRIVTDLMYKHWDEWVCSVPQPFIAEVAEDLTISNESLLPVLDSQDYYEVPIKPFGGVEELAWSVDSKTLAYSCKKKTGKAYALSTNTDIYLFNLETKKTENITEGMMGYDTNPSFSPDGKSIAWISMERDGYESDVQRLFTMDLNTKRKTWHTRNFDNLGQYEWSKDSKQIRFVSCVEALTNIYQIDLASDKVTTLTEGVHDVTGFSGVDNVFLCGIQSFVHPTDIYKVSLGKGKAKLEKLTHENDEVLSGIEPAKVKKLMVKTTDNKEMLTWLVLPPFFNEADKYPAILYCQGGPQSTVSQFWSYRWNLNTFASAGFIIVAPNRRGLPSFGREWLEQISGDYGGLNMKDYLAAIDTAAQLPYVDEEHLGCTGASYGGFSTYWLAGHHEKRFKAFFAHAGIFNLQAQYLETEELFFANWDMGGNYWDKTNEVAQKTYATSPHLFVEKWDTPIMISAGEKDYRILASQGMMAFDAAMIRDIPTEMLIYPDENHWILQPQNGVLFYRSWINWMSRWLKKDTSK